ncbi:glycosyltransferase family 4 protein [Oxynema aestuarii]|jgi:UDP-GlcNAc:undecaprenyl-phosphate GlcNAc-1-phosphate transferase|uniref:Undecaprenyl/decaprenyl-phosphate alpha-N-acetylglucosaminyl 1-phosphate transferase n=1 Tax=Oxynema aestuarii AP17 TaxID=2064643 RepID=A0A6H1U2V1_9CYAN|nr:MraY family glycosyltransferase [Oxynema aestuarii]QIZ72766.1 undecaprenyl/decaprenyl-phosphate alpha-N-acetylglucosaminyl 1-phosphate transferase [Oxynema aestuarii AP17]RMH75731.1 MAG: undecaprenyl/decaprenyl-phosphate alpha-N-acetylglucosaminyl 1-phosphate transferase [Cyanobacteria bacterium J007]
MPYQPFDLVSLYHLVAFIVSAVVVLCTTPWVKKIALKSGRVDLPGGRKVHSQPMVRLGGVSIFLGALSALLIVWWTGGFGILPPDKEYEIWGVTIGGLAFFLIGLADDLFGLSPFMRLFLQGIVAGAAWNVGVQIEFISIPFAGLVTLPDWISFPITIVWLVGMTNAINWIDGLDGLAAGVSGIAAVVMLTVSLFMHQPAAALIAAALAGGTLGFLRYNFNPAQIFMGDGGSYYIGFTLAGVGVIGLVKTTAVTAVVLPYIILAVPILDMSAVIVDRLRNGKSPFTADKRHLHHRLLAAGLSHRLTVLFIYSLTLWVGSIALAFAGIPSGIAYALGATALLSYTSWKVMKHAR